MYNRFGLYLIRVLAVGHMLFAFASLASNSLLFFVPAIFAF